MNKKKTVFNLKFFIMSFKQLMNLGLISTVIMVLFSVLPVISAAMRIEEYNMVEKTQTLITVSFIGSNNTILLLFVVVAPVLALYGWNFLTKRNACDFYHALPYTRKCMYISRLAAIVAWQTAIVMITYLSTVIVYKVYGDIFAVSYASIFRMFLAMWCASMLCIAAVTLACCITGNLINNICVTGIVLFFVRVIVTMITAVMSSAVPVLLSDKVNILLDNSYNIIVGIVMYAFAGIGDGINSIVMSPVSNIYTIVLAVIYFIVAGVIFGRRKSESAGHMAINRKMQFVLRMVVAFAFCSIGVSAYIVNQWENTFNSYYSASDNFFSTIVVFFIVAAVVSVIYECISSKSIHSVKKCILPVLAAYVLGGVMYVGLSAGINAVTSYAPKADDVEYVTITTDSRADDDYFVSMANHVRITDYAVKDRICDIIADNGSHIKKEINFYRYAANGHSNRYVVKLKDGLFTNYRIVYMSDEDMAYIFSHLKDEKEYQELYTKLPEKNVEISTEYAIEKEDAKALYETLRSEYAELSVGQIQGMLSQNHNYYCIYASVNINDRWYSMTLPLTKDTPKAYAMYYQALNRKNRTNGAKALEEMAALMKNISDISDLDARRRYYDDSNMEINFEVIKGADRFYYSIEDFINNEDGCELLTRISEAVASENDSDFNAERAVIMMIGRTDRGDEKYGKPEIGEPICVEYAVTLDGYSELSTFEAILEK